MTFVNYISIDGAQPKPMNEITPEEKAYCQKKWGEKISSVLSDYFTQHPGEYKKFVEELNRTDAINFVKSR